MPGKKDSKVASIVQPTSQPQRTLVTHGLDNGIIVQLEIIPPDPEYPSSVGGHTLTILQLKSSGYVVDDTTIAGIEGPFQIDLFTRSTIVALRDFLNQYFPPQHPNEGTVHADE